MSKILDNSNNSSKGKDIIEYLIQNDKIIFELVNFARGKSFDNALILIAEALLKYETITADEIDFLVKYGSLDAYDAYKKQSELLAKAKVEAAANYATKADQEKPLEGENIDGIEAEDAVLLEADSYAAPETQEAEIPEEIEDFEVEDFKGNDSSLEGLVKDAVDSINETVTSTSEAK